MRASLAIGDFARATHLSVKTLHHYHRIGLLEPADVDAANGYRHYSTQQIPTAQVIRRFRALDMPLDEIHAVIAAPDVGTRNELIAAHLSRLEGNLARTQDAVASLRNLLQAPSSASSVDIRHRRVEATTAAAISEVIDVDTVLAWYHGALGELYATLGAQHLPATGAGGGIFSNDLFTLERGEATIFVPCAGPPLGMGRVRSFVVPGVELATIVHAGPHTDLDRAYGSLANYVAEQALAVEGPIREYYLVGSHHTPDQAEWRTEIGWPIFQTGTTV